VSKWTFKTTTTTSIFSVIRFPFWVDFKIVINSLMSEEKILVSEFGSSELTVKDEVTNVGFFATKFFWLVPGEDFVEVGVSWNLCELRNTREEILRDWKSVPSEQFVDIIMRLKS